jgi:cyanophycinase
VAAELTEDADREWPIDEVIGADLAVVRAGPSSEETLASRGQDDIVAVGVAPLRLAFLIAALAAVVARAEDPRGGSLLIIGGHLRPDNARVYKEMIRRAGGKDKARIGILPTASLGLDHSRRGAEDLVQNGLPAERVVILDITTANGSIRAADPSIAKQIRACTGLFFTGGDQLWITRVFLAANGAETPILAAVREVYRRGGVIAGTSAGAAIMGERMISARGVPMDALDFGRAPSIKHRGVFLSQGFGLFKAGLVDQHFNTYDGRLARLARVLVAGRDRLGFGVDENTAMLVRPDGGVEVLGPGGVTVVDASKAAWEDGPLGCRITGLSLTYLEQDDAFDPSSARVTISPAKGPIAPGQESYDGNRLITDLSQDNAITHAVTEDLVDNTSRSQAGLLLSYNGRYVHGYKLTFSKTDATRGYFGFKGNVPSYAATAVRLDVEPVLGDLGAASESSPSDLAECSAPREVQAVVFRGIMLRDREGRFRPGAALTRGELANVLISAMGINRRSGTVPSISDVTAATGFAADIERVVALGLLTLEGGSFHPEDSITRQDAATALLRAYHFFYGTFPTDSSLPDVGTRGSVFAPLDSRIDAGNAVPPRPLDHATREEVATAIFRLLKLSW